MDGASVASRRWRILSQFVHHRSAPSDAESVSIKRILDFQFLASSFPPLPSSSPSPSSFSIASLPTQSTTPIESTATNTSNPSSIETNNPSNTELHDNNLDIPAGWRIQRYNLPLSLPHPLNPTIDVLSRTSTTPTLSEISRVMGTQHDTTGLVAVWPAEEALAYYLCARPELVRGMRVLEIGAGSGLAGLCAGAAGACAVMVTDGNCDTVEVARKTGALNPHAAKNIEFAVLEWGPIAQKYNVILAADCLYFEHAHPQLIELLQHGLTEFGCAYFVCPARGLSLARFVARVEESRDFAVDVVSEWDEHVGARIREVQLRNPTLFDENLHALKLVTVRFKKN